MHKTDSTNTNAAPSIDTGAAKQNRRLNYPANSVAAQRKRIAYWFAQFSSLTTEQARQHLDIMHPAGRIKELRARGFEILTVWDDWPTACGKFHRMARYVYIGRTGGAT